VVSIISNLGLGGRVRNGDKVQSFRTGAKESMETVGFRDQKLGSPWYGGARRVWKVISPVLGQ